MSVQIVQTSLSVGDGYWDWEIHFEGKDEDLHRIKYVEYVLHETFEDPVRKIRNRDSGFKLETSGWGTFRVYITIHLKNGSDQEVSFDITFEKTRIKTVSLE